MYLAEEILNGYATLDDQDEALKDPYTAYLFARNVPGADIERCQEAACNTPGQAYDFAELVPGADIKKCQEVICKDPMYAYNFALYTEGADMMKCIEACRGTGYESMLNQYLMDKALL